ncbi:hypothetical protein [Pseudomonas veronii]
MKNHDDVEKEFFSLIDTEVEYLSLVVKCHYAIDKMLDKALSESLPQASSIELKRISLLLKVDFLTSMGRLGPDTRKIFELANTIRNKFAHDPYADFDTKDSAKAKSVLRSHKPPLVPESFNMESDPKNILKTVFSVCFLQASVAYENTCRRKVSNIVAHQLAEESLRHVKNAARNTSLQDDYKARCERMLSEIFPGVGHQ